MSRALTMPCLSGGGHLVAGLPASRPSPFQFTVVSQICPPKSNVDVCGSGCDELTGLPDEKNCDS